MNNSLKKSVDAQFNRALSIISKKLSDWHFFKCNVSEKDLVNIITLNVYGNHVPEALYGNDNLSSYFTRAALPTLTKEEYLEGSKWLTNFNNVAYEEESPRYKGLFESFASDNTPAPLVLEYYQKEERRSLIRADFNGKKYHSFPWDYFWKTEKIDNWSAVRRDWDDLVCDSGVIVIVNTLTSKLIREIYKTLHYKFTLPTYDYFPEQPIFHSADYQKWCDEVHEYHRYKGYGYFPSVVIFSIDTIFDEKDLNCYCQNNPKDALLKRFKSQADRKTKKIQEEIAAIKEQKRIKDLYEYNVLHCHKRDANVKLHDNGIATFFGINYDYPPTIINSLFPTYKLNEIAREEGERRGVSTKLVKSEWDKKGLETTSREKLLHENIEKWFTGKTVNVDSTFAHFKQFQESTHLWPYRSQWTIYDEEYKVAALVDLIELKNGCFYLYKFKSSDNILEGGLPKKIDERMGTGKYPVQHLSNTAYTKCALELNLIKFILSKDYDIEVEDMRLGVFHPMYGKPYVIRIPDLQEEIVNILNARSDILF